jgi:hypothetical protein
MLSIAPASHVFSITPSDSAALPQPTIGIYVGGTGDVTVKTSKSANAVTFKAVPVGVIIPVAAQYVMATNTTATLLTGLAP